MDIDPDTLKRIYETMVTIRAFEERSGREIPAPGASPGALHLSVGQEAVPAGICAHLTNGGLPGQQLTGATATASPRGWTRNG